MSINKNIREKLPSDTVVFDNLAYDNSIIGVTFDNRAIYNYDSMLLEIMEDEDMSLEEAADWISYNTIRSLSYVSGNKPLIVYIDDDY